ncbi:BaeS Signal transduction histidine kinase [Comamonadaceae bacterium]
MSSKTPSETLKQFERRAFAHYFVFDLHFPLVAVALLSGVCVWMMYGRVANEVIAAWAVLSLVANAAREVFMWRSRTRMDDPKRHSDVLRVYTVSSLASGVSWGVFTWLYVDFSQPMAQLFAGSIMAGLIAVAVTPLSVHPPAFLAFVLPILVPYVYLMVRSGQTEQLLLAGMTMVFLGVITRYAYDSHRMHRETVRLRFENQHLITDLKQRNAEAENASHTKSLFLAGVSHDLKQPMRAIGLFFGVLRHTEPHNSANVLGHVLPKMEKALGDLHAQVSRLLELSRLQSGTLKLQIAYVELADLFAHMHTLFDNQAAAKGIRLAFTSLDRLRHKAVWGDRLMLESILQNLISNAIKHTDSGTVYVGVRQRTGYRPGRQLCIEVRDSGSGIPLERQALLFDAYRSFDDQQASESHGLGLAIAKAQASYMTADIAVRSAPGRGSVFTLCGLSTHNSKAATHSA